MYISRSFWCVGCISFFLNPNKSKTLAILVNEIKQKIFQHAEEWRWYLCSCVVIFVKLHSINIVLYFSFLIAGFPVLSLYCHTKFFCMNNLFDISHIFWNLKLLDCIRPHKTNPIWIRRNNYNINFNYLFFKNMSLTCLVSCSSSIFHVSLYVNILCDVWQYLIQSSKYSLVKFLIL